MNNIKYIAVEIYDNQIRYDGRVIYSGNVKGKTQAEIDNIVDVYKSGEKQPPARDGREVDTKYDYRLNKMPNGEFVGEVYYFTHRVIKALNAVINNEQFIAAETLIRDFVWEKCVRAHMQALPTPPATKAKGDL